MKPFNKLSVYVRKIRAKLPVRGFGGTALKVVVGSIGATFITAAMLQPHIVTPNATHPPESVLTGSFSTARGEHRCWRFPEESEVCLNTSSAVRFSFSRNARKIEVLAGEALFTVNSGDKRPFEVLSGDLVIRDVSTSFDVYRRTSNSTLVTVISGRVKIMAASDTAMHQEFSQAAEQSAWDAAPEYHRLQQVEFDSATRNLHARHTLTEDGLSQLMAWQRGWIVLNGRTISEAFAEISRYQAIKKVSIPDKELRNHKVGGEIRATSLMDFLEYLHATHGVNYIITRDAEGKMTVTLSRQRIASDHS
jgi:transmembrane sensor